MNDILLLFIDTKLKITGLRCYAHLWSINLINVWEKLQRKKPQMKHCILYIQSMSGPVSNKITQQHVTFYFLPLCDELF